MRNDDVFEVREDDVYEVICVGVEREQTLCDAIWAAFYESSEPVNENTPVNHPAKVYYSSDAFHRARQSMKAVEENIDSVFEAIEKYK